MKNFFDPLEYHRYPPAGKIAVVPTKPTATQGDLALAYSPGVAAPCREIAADPAAAYEYTAKGNLVGVISNGTAVLGLGDIGPLAAKPVMEGKGVLFKRFADIDVFDIELNLTEPEKIIETIQALAPTFGGINLEDFRAPECFAIEEELVRRLDIPVFHDDQHGTAIISGAALENALAIQGKPIAEATIVVNGAGAAGIACAKLYLALGARRENLVLVDSLGVIHAGRTRGMNPYKAEFATDRPARTLAEAMAGADVFVGLSVAGAVTPEMVRSMAARPIVFALANPDPEIPYDVARAARPDAIVATGRSDFPNQVNNVLGFPFIFRGALDTRATRINEAMKLAAVRALSRLARESTPDSVSRAYGGIDLFYGPEYIIPKPFDERVLLVVAPAVAQAAMDSGVARRPIADLEAYRDGLEKFLGLARPMLRAIIHRARRDPQAIVFAEGESRTVQAAAIQVAKEGIGCPIILGDARRIRAAAEKSKVDLARVAVVDPHECDFFDELAQALFDLRKRKGMTLYEANRELANPNIFGAMMVRTGRAGGLVTGVTSSFPDAIRPVLGVLDRRPDASIIAGIYALHFRDRTLLLADPAVNVEPTAEQLAEIAIMAGDEAGFFDLVPRVAMLSFSDFGGSNHPLARKVRDAVRIVNRRRPDLEIDGEMMADTAVDYERLKTVFGFSTLTGPPTVLIFPDLTSANTAYKLLTKLGSAEVVGPILMGMKHPFNALARQPLTGNVVAVAAITCVQAQRRKAEEKG
jgi:malate dehydrogenase (oxaloacetate-decarboxylating)(NADP+)